MTDRHYIKRPMSLLWKETRVTLETYLIDEKRVLDAEGTYDGEVFDNLNELVELAGWSQSEAVAFMTRFQEVLES